ncbi:MAG: hypothetical protein E6I52_23955 [Chloroflexi bacterium]|nr:MAG: hypothetical protein E6I52_23955 [Chloroflexota bacterium]
MFDRLNRALQQHLDPNRTPAQPRQPTLETLLPGDVVSFWDAGDNVVQAVLECREELNRRETVWRWDLLDEGRVLEVTPEGNTLYERTAILHQSSAEFETLTADPEQGGVLKAFEARVRQGTAARNPTLFEYDSRVYRVVSTGIFDARPLDQAAYPNLDVWRDINPSNPGDNVYFELEPTEDTPGDDSGSEVLGIWTSHIALLFGRPLKAGDIQTIYPRAEQEGQR